MKPKDLHILLCTHGGAQTLPGLDFGVELAGALRLPVVLLGIVEKTGQTSPVRAVIDETAGKLAEGNIPYSIEYVSGQAEEVIQEQASSAPYLTVVGRLGRPLLQQWIAGRSFRHILADVSTPLIYVPSVRWPLKRVLVCSGGLKYASSLARFSFYLAKATGARVTLLHVVEPATLDYTLAQEVEKHWEKLLETDTPQGRNLKKMYDEALAAGLETDVRLRHGNVIHEIQEELKGGEYDLIGLGSPYSSRSLRHYYMPNVTAEVAESVGIPVLTVRFGFDL